MFTMRDHLVEAERRRDEMRRAEYRRLVRQATPTNNFNSRLCIHLGNILVRTGRRLQTRYAAPSYYIAASNPKTVSH
jgi:hypothetical protein